MEGDYSLLQRLEHIPRRFLSCLFFLKNTQSHEKQHKVKGFIFKTDDRRIALEMWVEMIPGRQLTQVVHHKKEQRELNKKKMGLF